MRDDLAEEGIDEECESGSVQSVFNGTGRRQEVGWVGVGNELGDDAGLGDDVSVVRETRDQAALYDVGISDVLVTAA